MRKLVVALSASALKELFGRDVEVVGASVVWKNLELDVIGIGPELTDPFAEPPIRRCRSLSDLKETVNGGPRKNQIHNTVPGECAQRTAG